jgi:transcriptional regulator with XRE-family HTH domain
MSLNFNIIGTRLKQARLNKKITQEKLAEMIDVSVTYVSKIERGSTNINLKRLSELCDILEVSEGEILNGTSNKSPSYMTKEFNDLLKNCPAEKINLIYNIAELIVNDNI